MEVKSQFASRYKKDMSVENLRAKIARRNSITQKENRDKAFRKGRGLTLVDANVASAKAQDLSTVEEVNESYITKVPINKPAPVKARNEPSLARRALLQRFKVEKELRRQKEEREKASKGAFKCGIYKPENPFIIKPAPPVVTTRVTRSAAKASAPVQVKPSQMPSSNRMIPKGCSQSSLQKNEKENKVGTVPSKSTKVTTAATRLPAVSKAPVKAPAVSKPQKPLPKKPEPKVATAKPKPPVTNKASTNHVAPEPTIKVAIECPTSVETELLAPHERKPSFAPENFEFQPLDGLSTYTFHPMTPNRANAFLTPTFTWSPVGKSNFVFSRGRETEEVIMQVSPPVQTVKTPTNLEMGCASPKLKECTGVAMPIDLKTSPCEMIQSPTKLETTVDQAAVGAAQAVNVVTSPVEGTPDEQKMGTEISPKSRDTDITPSADEVRHSPLKDMDANASLKGDTAALPNDGTTPQCFNSNGPLQPEVAQHDVPYFRGLLKSEIRRLTMMCSEWDKRIDMEIPEDAKDLVRTTVGQTRLLITERFKQFEGLVDNCEFRLGEKETTCTDLDGFWDMIYFQIEDVGKKFVNLQKLEANAWQQTKVQARKAVRKKSATKPAVNNQGDTGRAAARDRLAAIKAALRNKVKPKDVTADTATAEQPVLTNPVVFDAVFFRIESPAKPLGGWRTRNLSHSSCTPKSTQKVQKISDDMENTETRGDGEAIKSPIRKSLFSTEDDRLDTTFLMLETSHGSLCGL
ncbi:disks large-associated protein 5 [Gastrophryne carolinensis]